MSKLQEELSYISNGLKRMFWLLMIFTLVKIVFFAINQHLIPHPNFKESIVIFLQSLRFDTSALLYVNMIFVLSFILPFSFRSHPIYRKIQLFFFIVPNLFSIIFELIDVGFFPFSQRRFIKSDFDMMFDNLNMVPVYVLDNWYLTFFLAGMVYLLYRIFKKYDKPVVVKLNILSQCSIFIISILLSIIGLRGGLQLRPIVPGTAAEYVNESRQMPLIASTTMNLIFSTQQRFLSENKNFDAKLAENINPLIHQYQRKLTTKPQNVVVIVLESFGKEAIGFYNKYQCFTPFLDTFLTKTTQAKHSFANGLRSSQGITALASGIPAMMEDPLMFSAYQSNQIEGIGTHLNDLGYQSFFFHGANKGSMEFERFSKMCGIDHYYDIDEYPDAKDYDGSWGIWDDKYFQYFKNNLDTVSTPFYAMMFSLTSHHPYKVEQWFKEKNPSLNDFERATLYTDYALKHFFEEAKKTKWYDNTLFVILADHTGLSTHPEYQNVWSRYQVPIAFYHPNQTLKFETEQMQQIDIMPSILDYVGYQKPFFAFGKSCFNENEKNHTIINYGEGIYQIIDFPYLLLKNSNQIVGLFNLESDPTLKNDLQKVEKENSARLLQLLNIQIDQHHHAMIHNQLKLNREK